MSMLTPISVVLVNTQLKLRKYRVVHKNIAQILMHRHFATVCSRITRLYQNAQKLTDNTKNGQILIAVIKYSLFDSL